MLLAPKLMTFKVVYNYKPKIFDKYGKYIDNDTYTIIIDDVKMERNEKALLDIFTKEINEDELYELQQEIHKAIWERNDIRGYHE